MSKIKVSSELISPEASLVGSHMTAFLLCPYMVSLLCLYLCFCVPECLLFIKTLFRLD